MHVNSVRRTVSQALDEGATEGATAAVADAAVGERAPVATSTEPEFTVAESMADLGPPTTRRKMSEENESWTNLFSDDSGEVADDDHLVEPLPERLADLCAFGFDESNDTGPLQMSERGPFSDTGCFCCCSQCFTAGDHRRQDVVVALLLSAHRNPRSDPLQSLASTEYETGAGSHGGAPSA